VHLNSNHDLPVGPPGIRLELFGNDGVRGSNPAVSERRLCMMGNLLEHHSSDVQDTLATVGRRKVKKVDHGWSRRL
jgi:hypothetical protein